MDGVSCIGQLFRSRRFLDSTLFRISATATNQCPLSLGSLTYLLRPRGLLPRAKSRSLLEQSGEWEVNCD